MAQAKYNWNGSVLTITNEEDKMPPITFDLSKCPDKTMDFLVRFGAKTKVSNFTRGAEGDPVKYAELAAAGIKKLYEGDIEREQAAAVELTSAEREETILGVIVELKKLSGDQRSAEAISAAFKAAPESVQTAALAAYKKRIDKALNQKLKDKKASAKAEGDGKVALSGF